MSNAKTESLAAREDARRQGITLQTAYRGVWDGRVNAWLVYCRWLISPQLAPNRASMDRNALGPAAGVAIERAQD